MFHWLEKNPFLFAVGVFIVIAFAGLVEILPNFAEAARPIKGLKPYTVLQLAGKEVYKKDNCIACHSQLIRPFKSETDRYGKYSLSGEYAYDRPFLWGSKRTGPDLHRVGNYRTPDWHANHMWNPKSVVPDSIMPAYKHQFKNVADLATAYAEAVTVKKVFNTPYGDEIQPGKAAFEKYYKTIALPEALKIAKAMKNKDVLAMVQQGKIPEVVALVAYLERLK
ncbi:cytochrome-c oxidase, cbb3-type subunit II [Nitratifractor sp.]|uniref:cytochrome-c oxidase, cbb3-type subunit II n=1 Tax=Nitratifractor sp. TaxID=2268144 RepID=UPI0025D3E6BE|nr:cytochrome-c oxidase, cbb3-type subunit II [Nitratifractor sp.]